MGPDARRLLDVLSAPGDDDATVREARQLLGMTPGPFDEAFRYRWRGWLDAVGYGPTDFITGSQMAMLRRVRGRQSGEVTVILSGVGAVITGVPAVVALTGQQWMNGTGFILASLVALFAIGAGVGKVYGWWRRRIEADILRNELLQDLVAGADRMEKRQLGTQEQLRDLSDRFDKHLPRE